MAPQSKYLDAAVFVNKPPILAAKDSNMSNHTYPNSIELQTERLYIRPVKPADAVDMFRYRSDKETSKFLSWIPERLNDIEDFIENRVTTTLNLPDTWYQLSILKQGTDTVIGDIGIHFLDDERQVEIGYTLDKTERKKGYASEAVKAVISFLFSKLNKHRITASVDPANLPSFALLEKLGFRKEAHFKESLWLNGQWVDDVIYALLKSEWSD